MMHTGDSEISDIPAAASDMRRIALACGVGTAIERYDFFIYGTAAAAVFAPQFLPQVSQVVGRLAAFGTFALGFIALPLGGIVMEHFGDRVGRKSMLVWSLMLMGAATFLIGLLPYYSQIGIWRERRGLYGGFVALGLPTGLAHPFLASAVLVAIGFLVRLGVSESPVFAEVRRRHAQRRAPVLDILRSHWRTVLLAAGSYLSASALGYIATVYFVSYATQELALPLTTALVVVMSSALVLAGSVAMFSRWSDRWGRRRIMISGLCTLTVWSLIFFPLIDTKSVPLITLAVCGMMFLQGCYLGTQPAVFAELFPAAVRYSGALAPVIATALFGLSGSSQPIAAYLVTFSIISSLCALALARMYRRAFVQGA